jgi:hypothetical protein
MLNDNDLDEDSKYSFGVSGYPCDPEYEEKGHP